MNKSFGVDSKEFSEICPALIQQLKSNSCVTEKKKNEVKIPSKGSDNHGNVLVNDFDYFIETL